VLGTVLRVAVQYYNIISSVTFRSTAVCGDKKVINDRYILIYYYVIRLRVTIVVLQLDDVKLRLAAVVIA